MSKFIFIILFFSCLSCYSQYSFENDSTHIVLKKHRNVFMIEKHQLSKNEILNITPKHYILRTINKNIEDFYKFKANKNGYAVAAVSAVGLGGSIIYFAFREQGFGSESIFVSSIFGGATLCFTTGWMINKINFLKNKKRILKALS